MAAYPHSGPLVARLAQQYHAAGQTWRAQKLVQQYRVLFPEDTVVRAAQRQIEGPRNSIEPGRNPGQVQAQ